MLLLECLSRTMRALANELYLLNALVSTSSFTSLPISPTKMRKSLGGHSVSVGSHHTSPPAFRGTAGGFFFASFGPAACKTAPVYSAS